MVAQYFKAADAARIKNNAVRGLGAACGGRADLLRAIPSEDDHVFSKTPGETTKTPGDTLAFFAVAAPRAGQSPWRSKGPILQAHSSTQSLRHAFTHNRELHDKQGEPSLPGSRRHRCGAHTTKSCEQATSQSPSLRHATELQ